MSEESLTKAVFVREFHWGRPGANIGFGAVASDAPKSFPRDFIAAAIKAGAAVAVPAKGKPAS
jgi:hypothetical protein